MHNVYRSRNNRKNTPLAISWDSDLNGVVGIFNHCATVGSLYVHVHEFVNGFFRNVFFLCLYVEPKVTLQSFALLQFGCTSTLVRIQFIIRQSSEERHQLCGFRFWLKFTFLNFCFYFYKICGFEFFGYFFKGKNLLFVKIAVCLFVMCKMIFEILLLMLNEIRTEIISNRRKAN